MLRGGEMAKIKIFFVTMTIGVFVFAAACTKEGVDSSDKKIVENSAQSAEAKTPNAGLVDAIKKGKLANYQSKTIGKAFDSYKYLTKKEWTAKSLKSKHITVDFIGWFEPNAWFDPNSLTDKDIKDGITGRGINVKFVIEPTGLYYVFMVSKIESKSDGKVYGYELRDNTGILASIYANKKIKLDSR